MCDGNTTNISGGNTYSCKYEMELDITYPEDFAKIIRDSGFFFTLRRGRMDLSKIDAIDIDRVVEERDIVTLHNNLHHIMNYSLEEEFIRILNPGFIKLFKLAQLAIDYLMFMGELLIKRTRKTDLQLKGILEENEKIKCEFRSKAEELRYMKKKLKDSENINTVLENHVKSLNISSQLSKCNRCEKSFITPAFLNAHVARRHSELMQQKAREHSEEATHEAEALFLEVKALKDRLHSVEELLQETKEENRKYHEVKDSEKTVEDRLVEVNENYRKQIEELQLLLKSEIEKTNSVYSAEIKVLQCLTQEQEKRIKYLDELLSVQVEKVEKNVNEQLHKQEQEWLVNLENMEKKYAEALDKVTDLTQTSKDKKLLSEGSLLRTRLSEQEKTLSKYEEQQLRYESLLKEKFQEIDLLKKALMQKSSIHSNKSPIELNREIKRSVGANSKILINSSKSSSSSSSVTESPTTPTATEFMGDQVYTAKNIHLLRPHTVYTQQVKGKHTNPETISTAARRKHEKLQRRNEDSKIDNAEEKEEFKEKEYESEVLEVDGKKEKLIKTFIKEIDIEDQHAKGTQLKEFAAKANKLKTVLQKELAVILQSRLRELGVDPDWTHLPLASFEHKMEILEHQQHIDAKRYPDYFKIRQHLMTILEQKISALGYTSSIRTGMSVRKDTVPKGKSISQVESIVNRVKTKARALKQLENVSSPRLQIQPVEVHQQSVMKKPSTVKQRMPSHSTSSTTVLTQKSQKKGSYDIYPERDSKAITQDESDSSSSESSLTTIIDPKIAKGGQKFPTLTLSVPGPMKIQKKENITTGKNESYSDDTDISETEEAAIPPPSIGHRTGMPQLVHQTETVGSPQESKKQSSGALKSPASSISLKKKRVAFQGLSADESISDTQSQHEDQGKTWTKSMNEELGDFKSPSVKAAFDSEGAKQDSTRDGIHDKIKQIEQKLSVRDKKPRNGVDTVSTFSASQGLLDKEKNIVYTSTQNLQQLPLSEWDIEDLEEFE